jgi:hypothetical protein
LPYNPAAGVKYEFIGKNYALEDLTPHSEERAEGFARIFSRLGIRVELGR